jgi:hypothetical protein
LWDKALRHYQSLLAPAPNGIAQYPNVLTKDAPIHGYEFYYSDPAKTDSFRSVQLTAGGETATEINLHRMYLCIVKYVSPIVADCGPTTSSLQPNGRYRETVGWSYSAGNGFVGVIVGTHDSLDSTTEPYELLVNWNDLAKK